MSEGLNKPDNFRTLEQKRARYAWDCISELKNNKDNEVKKKYRSYVKDASALIQINGLGNVLAFYRSKIKRGESDPSPDGMAYSFLYNHINGWIKEKASEINDALEWITSENTSSMDVFRITMEVISLLEWLKRFAEAELPAETE